MNFIFVLITLLSQSHASCGKLENGAFRGCELKLKGLVTTIAGSGNVAGSNDGIGSKARFNAPTELTTDGQYLYLTDFHNHTIRRLNLKSKRVDTISGLSGKKGSTDGKLKQARYHRPVGLVYDSNKLYIVEFLNHTLRLLDLNKGLVSRIVGTPGVAGVDNGPGSKAKIRVPEGVMIHNNYIYIVEFSNHSVRRFNLKTNELEPFAGTPGQAGAADGLGQKARFRKPTRSIAIGNYLYVTDYGNNAIRRVHLKTAMVTTFVGQLGKAGQKDGDIKKSLIDKPSGITTDGINLYFTEYANTVKKIDMKLKKVTLLAGKPNSSGVKDGIGPEARFHNPSGLTTDGKRLYVSEYRGHVIRSIE